MGILLTHVNSNRSQDAGHTSIWIMYAATSSGSWRGACAAASRLLCGGDAVTSEHAIGLQDVVGERVPEHHRHDLGLATHIQVDEVPVAPSGVDALANCSNSVLCLSLVTLHPASPSQHARTVFGSRFERIAAVL